MSHGSGQGRASIHPAWLILQLATDTLKPTPSRQAIPQLKTKLLIPQLKHNTVTTSESFVVNIGSHYVAQPDFKLSAILHESPKFGTPGMCHHTWLTLGCAVSTLYLESGACPGVCVCFMRTQGQKHC